MDAVIISDRMPIHLMYIIYNEICIISRFDEYSLNYQDLLQVCRLRKCYGNYFETTELKNLNRQKLKINFPSDEGFHYYFYRLQ